MRESKRQCEVDTQGVLQQQLLLLGYGILPVDVSQEREVSRIANYRSCFCLCRGVLRIDFEICMFPVQFCTRAGISCTSVLQNHVPHAFKLRMR